MASHILERIGGLFELARIGVASRLRGGEAYWKWRRDTAFGSQAASVKYGTKKLSAWQRAGAMMRFGAWVVRMKRFR